MEREIPKKNYVLVVVILIITCLLLWYFVQFYRAKKDYELDRNKMMNILSELKTEELQNYVMDNHDIILYLSSSRENSYEAFEKDLKKYLRKEDLTKSIVYLDTSFVDGAFYKNFTKDYFPKDWQDQKMELLMIPNIVVMTDGQVSKLLYYQQAEPKIEDVKAFFKGEE